MPHLSKYCELYPLDRMFTRAVPRIPFPIHSVRSSGTSFHLSAGAVEADMLRQIYEQVNTPTSMHKLASTTIVAVCHNPSTRLPPVRTSPLLASTTASSP